MKTLLITLLLASSTLANKTPPLMECEMVLEMFRFSADQGNPVTKEQLTGAIDACDGLEKHHKTVDAMKKLLLTM